MVSSRDPFEWLLVGDLQRSGIKRPRIESPGYMDAISFDPFSCSAVFLFESEVGNEIFHHFFNQQKIIKSSPSSVLVGKIVQFFR